LDEDRLSRIAIWGLQPEQKVRRGQVWETFQNEHRKQLIITADQWEHMNSMDSSLMNHGPAAKYLASFGDREDTEVSMFWIDAGTGRRMKARPDKIIKGGAYDVLINLKTCRSCTPYQFGAAAYKLGYHISAAHYISGYRALTGREAKYKWIAVEKKPPYECAVYRATPDVITQGGEDLDALIKRLAECERTNHWPPELEEESDLMLPTYAYSDDLPGFGKQDE
jgi:exodeoxyribonuclease VIII